MRCLSKVLVVLALFSWFNAPVKACDSFILESYSIGDRIYHVRYMLVAEDDDYCYYVRATGLSF